MEPPAFVSSRHSRGRLPGLLLIVALLATIAAPAPRQSDFGSSDYQLMMSAGPNRNLRAADAGLLAGNPAIFISPAAGVTRVRYYVDASAGDLELSTVAGKPFATADQPPFRLSRQGGFDTRALNDGPHTLVAAIDLADGSTVVKAARVQIYNGGPALLFDATPLQLTLPQGGHAERVLRLLTSTGATARYNLSSDAPWLKLESPSPIGNPNTGSAPGSHIVEFDARELSPGRHTATLTASAQGLAPATTTISLVVLAPTANCAPLDCSQVKVVVPSSRLFAFTRGQ